MQMIGSFIFGSVYCVLEGKKYQLLQVIRVPCRGHQICQWAAWYTNQLCPSSSSICFLSTMEKNNYAKCAIGHFEIENNVCDDLIDTQVNWAAVKRERKVDIIEITLVESRWIIWHILPISPIWRVLKIRWVKHSSNFMACTHVLLVKYSRFSGLLFIHFTVITRDFIVESQQTADWSWSSGESAQICEEEVIARSPSHCKTSS